MEKPPKSRLNKSMISKNLKNELTKAYSDISKIIKSEFRHHNADGKIVKYYIKPNY